MTRTNGYALSLLATAVLGSVTAAFAVTPDRIREEFARSNDSHLQLAADALGDDGILEQFEKLQKAHPLRPEVQRVLERLKATKKR